MSDVLVKQPDGSWVSIKGPVGQTGQTGPAGAASTVPGPQGTTGPAGAGMVVGQSTVAFSTFKGEDSVTVTGQTGLTSNSRITACIYADTDDVYAQDWHQVAVRNQSAGNGFDLVVRPALGTFKGAVKVNWGYV